MPANRASFGEAQGYSLLEHCQQRFSSCFHGHLTEAPSHDAFSRHELELGLDAAESSEAEQLCDNPGPTCLVCVRVVDRIAFSRGWLNRESIRWRLSVRNESPWPSPRKASL